MPNVSDIRWFKENFATPIAKAVKGTPFDLDMLVAIACQETGELWPQLRKKDLTVDQIVALCCGDTLDDTAGRKAFPKNKDALLAADKGQEMFDIARAALVNMGAHIEKPYGKIAKNNKNKFCHGFGIFQYDLQFFKVDPDYFLKKKYEKFDNTVAHAVTELTSALGKVGLKDAKSLTDFQFATVAIAYNKGSYNPAKGLKQGYKTGDKFYGENVFDFVTTSRTVAVGDGTPQIEPVNPGTAIVPPPPALAAKGPRFRVETMQSTLRLRSEPRISTPPGANVIAELPDGHDVRAVSGTEVKGFIEVEATLGGAVFRGFASAKFLVKLPAAAGLEAVAAAAAAPAANIPAVSMPRKAGTVTKRTATAGAHSLNEDNMPKRTGDGPDALRADLGKIIAYLNPEKETHKRYKSTNTSTFCNIYAHDYCMLAGVYFPRVWWTEPALMKIATGQTVQPLYGETIREMRANDLFRWLRDFGQLYGWRQATSTNELQQNANQGAVCLIIARRKDEDRSGHVVAVVPETNEKSAKRNAQGVVTSPLQSQAGASNFNYGTSTPEWWKADRFAESAFWVHA